MYQERAELRVFLDSTSEVGLQSVAAVPLRKGLLRILGKEALAFSCGDLAPRWCVVQHQADMLWRFGEESVYRRGEGVDKVGPPRVVKPEEAPAEPAEVALRLAGRCPPDSPRS